MKTDEVIKTRLEQKTNELTSRIIEGTNKTDKNGEFEYSNEDLLNLCRLNQLSESIK